MEGAGQQHPSIIVYISMTYIIKLCKRAIYCLTLLKTGCAVGARFIAPASQFYCVGWGRSACNRVTIRLSFSGPVKKVLFLWARFVLLALLYAFGVCGGYTTNTVFTSLNSSTATAPSSRWPLPLAFMPPKGR